MICAWDALICILPIWMRADVNQLQNQCLQEIRLRRSKRPEFILKDRSIYLNKTIQQEDLQFIINTASNYSPWAATTISKGYITAAGGHRIGICGDAVMEEGRMKGIRSAEMLCIRVARDFPGISSNIPKINESILIIGCPGSGKTTMLRDLIRRHSNTEQGSIGIVDERGEIFPKHNGVSCFQTGNKTDVLSGCSKRQGIEILIRCMNPVAVAVDEITSEEDSNALLHAAWCGVVLYATAHAGSINDLFSRPVYKPLLENKIFHTVIIMRHDKSWEWENIGK